MQELNYLRCGNYYIPDIRLERPNIRLGKWGRMRREYLRLAHPVLFSELVLSEKLYAHCAKNRINSQEPYGDYRATAHEALRRGGETESE